MIRTCFFAANKKYIENIVHLTLHIQTKKRKKNPCLLVHVSVIYMRVNICLFLHVYVSKIVFLYTNKQFNL